MDNRNQQTQGGQFPQRPFFMSPWGQSIMYPAGLNQGGINPGAMNSSGINPGAMYHGAMNPVPMSMYGQFVGGGNSFVCPSAPSSLCVAATAAMSTPEGWREAQFVELSMNFMTIRVRVSAAVLEPTSTANTEEVSAGQYSRSGVLLRDVETSVTTPPDCEMYSTVVCLQPQQDVVYNEHLIGEQRESSLRQSEETSKRSTQRTADSSYVAHVKDIRGGRYHIPTDCNGNVLGNKLQLCSSIKDLMMRVLDITIISFSDQEDEDMKFIEHEIHKEYFFDLPLNKNYIREYCKNTLDQVRCEWKAYWKAYWKETGRQHPKCYDKKFEPLLAYTKSSKGQERSEKMIHANSMQKKNAGISNVALLTNSPHSDSGGISSVGSEDVHGRKWEPPRLKLNRFPAASAPVSSHQANTSTTGSECGNSNVNAKYPRCQALSSEIQQRDEPLKANVEVWMGHPDKPGVVVEWRRQD